MSEGEMAQLELAASAVAEGMIERDLRLVDLTAAVSRRMFRPPRRPGRSRKRAGCRLLR